MLLCGVGKLLVAEQFLNNKSYRISMFFSKVRITCFLDHDSSFISVIHDINLLPVRAFIRPMSRLSTPIILANVKLGVWILLALCSCWRLLLLVQMQKCWMTDRLTVDQPFWDSAKLSRHLLTLRLALDA